jgi:chemotaxis methyl-accepting protein methylase
VEKLLSLQISTFNNFKEYLKEIAMNDSDFFREAPEQFKRLQTLIDEELIKPTTSLTDLVNSDSLSVRNIFYD